MNVAAVSSNMAANDLKNDIQFVEETNETNDTVKSNQIIQIENFQVLGLDPEDADFYINFSEEKRKRVIHKVSLSLFCSLPRVG